MKQMKAAHLVIDYTIYPRNNVDEHNIRAIMEAIRAGATMPPVLVDQKTKRIVDGVHRNLAKLRIDPESTIDVMMKSYRDDAAMFLDAVRLNATHGARLDPCDRTRCILLAEKLSIAPEAMAGALNMSVDKLASLRATRTASAGGGLTIPIKRTISHMAGGRLNQAQEAAHVKLSGMNQSFHVNQLITLIESKLIDTSDAKLMERLRVLSELLESVLGATV